MWRLLFAHPVTLQHGNDSSCPAGAQPSQRRVALMSARQSYAAYLHRLVQYKALGGEALVAAEEALDAVSCGEGDEEEPAPRIDPNTLRQRKIAFFKRSVELWWTGEISGIWHQEWCLWRSEVRSAAPGSLHHRPLLSAQAQGARATHAGRESESSQGSGRR